MVVVVVVVVGSGGKVVEEGDLRKGSMELVVLGTEYYGEGW